MTVKKYCMIAMQEKPNQFPRNPQRTVHPRPSDPAFLADKSASTGFDDYAAQMFKGLFQVAGVRLLATMTEALEVSFPFSSLLAMRLCVGARPNSSFTGSSFPGPKASLSIPSHAQLMLVACGREALLLFLCDLGGGVTLRHVVF